MRNTRFNNTLSLAFRSLLWVALLPAVVAGYLPWRYFGLQDASPRLSDPLHVVGLLATATGVTILARCVWDFAHLGRGTLSPVDPPTILVRRGLYRYVRNPMYLGVTMIVLGEVALTRSGALLVYWAIWFALVNLIVIIYEEPRLRQRFGNAYIEYTNEVGRWIPRGRPRPGSKPRNGPSAA